MAHCKKWHQLINIHEPFTWAPLCVLQGLIQTETRLFCSSADCVTPPFVGETHQLVFQGNVSPHWEPNLPPLSPSSSCAPSALRGRKLYLLEEAIHLSCLFQSNSQPLHMYEDICPYLIRYSILLQMIPPSIPTHEGGSYLNVLILSCIITCQFFALQKKQV